LLPTKSKNCKMPYIACNAQVPTIVIYANPVSCLSVTLKNRNNNKNPIYRKPEDTPCVDKSEPKIRRKPMVINKLMNMRSNFIVIDLAVKNKGIQPDNVSIYRAYHLGKISLFTK